MTKDLVSAIQRIESERRVTYSEMLGKQRDAELLAAAVDAYDRALAELNKATPEEALPVKVPRLDIGKAVVTALSNGPLTIAQLAETIGRKPSQVSAAIIRLRSNGTVGAVPGNADYFLMAPAAEAAQ